MGSKVNKQAKRQIGKGLMGEVKNILIVKLTTRHRQEGKGGSIDIGKQVGSRGD